MQINKNIQPFTGKVWCFSDHLNTDIIHPPSFFSLDPEKVKKGLFNGFDASIQPRMKAGDVIIGGANFGCGSSRETSIRSLQLNKVGAIIAVDFARIFFRNATNVGLPCLTFENPNDQALFNTGDILHIDVLKAVITLDNGHQVACKPAGAFIQTVWKKGGLLETLPQSY